jgi:hypothetical protein
MSHYKPSISAKHILTTLATDKIKHRREALIKALLDPVKSFLANPAAGQKGLCEAHKNYFGKFDRDHKQVRAVFASMLNAAQLMPLPTPEACEHSVGTLFELLKGVVSSFQADWTRIMRVTYPEQNGCTECKPLKEIIECWTFFYKRPFLTLSQAQRNHMESQRRKSGVAPAP